MLRCMGGRSIGRGVASTAAPTRSCCRGCRTSRRHRRAPRPSRAPAPGPARRRRRPRTDAATHGRLRFRCRIMPMQYGGAGRLRRQPVVIPSTRTVGASVPRRKRRSLAGVRWANMSSRLPAMVISATGSASRAVADHEAGGAAAVVAGDAVHAHADQLGDIEAQLDVRHQLGRRQRRRHRDTGWSVRARAARRCRATHGRSGACRAAVRSGCRAARWSARRPR